MNKNIFLENLIAEKGFNNASLARKIGVSKTSIGHWVDGETPRKDLRIKVAKALGSKVDAIFPSSNAEGVNPRKSIAVLTERVCGLERENSSLREERDSWRAQAQSFFASASADAQQKPKQKENIMKDPQQQRIEQLENVIVRWHDIIQNDPVLNSGGRTPHHLVGVAFVDMAKLGIDKVPVRVRLSKEQG
jgi:DNA-binding XRE family transcriptional regulator